MPEKDEVCTSMVPVSSRGKLRQHGERGERNTVAYAGTASAGGGRGMSSSSSVIIELNYTPSDMQARYLLRLLAAPTKSDTSTIQSYYDKLFPHRLLARY
eukprot:764410-Hanusia_phi.AAC.4